MTMKVKGAKETARNFRQLARFVSVPLNATSRFALQPTLSAARSNVRSLPLDESTGALAKSLTIRKMPGGSKLSPVHKVGPRSEYETISRRPVRYAHLVEFGTAPHLIRGQFGERIDHPGAAPKPFLTPAFFSTRDDVVRRFGSRMGQEMEKRAAKLGATVKR